MKSEYCYELTKAQCELFTADLIKNSSLLVSDKGELLVRRSDNSRDIEILQQLKILPHETVGISSKFV